MGTNPEKKIFDSLEAPKKISRENENPLRRKVMEAIKETEKYWLIFSYETYGIAGYFQLPHKKIYIELLFFAPESDSYPFLIHAVGNTTLDFADLYKKYKISSNIEPLAVIKDLEKLVFSQSKEQTKKLENEIREIRKENILIPIKDQKFTYIFRLIYGKITIDLVIDLSKYPRAPVISLKSPEHEKELKKIHSEIPTLIKQTTDEQIKKWKENSPTPISELLMDVETQIGSSLKEEEIWIRKKTQFIETEDLVIGENYKEITFKVRKGEHLGIYSKSDQQVDSLFRILSRQSQSYRGKLNIFGNEESQSKNTEDYRSTIIWLNFTFSDEELNKKIKQIVEAPRKMKKKALEGVFLDYDTSKRLRDCSEIELLRIKIANALCLQAGAIALRIPTENLGKMETEQISRIVTKIKENFDVILLIHGPKEIIENCDKILVLKDTEKTEKAGTLEELNEKMPETGEIILLQLSNPTQEEIATLYQLPDTEVIELRKGEKFKIFSRLNPETLIIQLFEKFGTKIFNLQRNKMRLGELLELNEFTHIDQKEEITQ